jgi:thiol:disulfide interchange protein DsbC
MKLFFQLTCVLLLSFLGQQKVYADPVAIQKRLATLLPPDVAYRIDAKPLAGFYAVTTGLNVFYISEDGRYLLTGDFVDLQSRANLTEVKEKALRVSVLSDLPRNELIRFPAKGKVRAEIYAFTDVDCPYCHKLHAEVSSLNAQGVSVNYLAYPRTAPGSSSWVRSESVWCSDTPTRDLEAAMQGQQITRKTCSNPVAQHQALGSQMGINGTPAMILPDGTLLPGYGTASEILKVMGLQ